jgi:hypothetical protein
VLAERDAAKWKADEDLKHNAFWLLRGLESLYKSAQVATNDSQGEPEQRVRAEQTYRMCAGILKETLAVFPEFNPKLKTELDSTSIALPDKPSARSLVERMHRWAAASTA